MAGKMCPKCGKQTLWDKGAKLECSSCGYKVMVPSNGGMGGKVKSVLCAENIHGFEENVIRVVQRKDKGVSCVWGF